MKVKKRNLRLRGTLDGGLSWFVPLGSFMIQFVVMGIHNVFGLLYIDLLEEFEESKATTAWVASISLGLTFALGPLSCALIEKFGCEVVSITGGVLSGLGLLLSSFVDSIYRMYVTYSFLFSLGCSLAHFSSVLVLRNYFSKYLGVSHGIGLSGAGVGTMTLAPALSLLLDNYHWRDALCMLSVTCLILVISGVIYFLVPVPMEITDAGEHKDKPELLGFSVLKNKALVVWISAVTLITFGFYIPYVHLVRHGQDLGIRKQDTAVLVGYMAMSQTFGKIVFGRIADHPRVNRLYLYQMCLLVCSVLTTLLPVFTTYDSLLAYCLLFGFHDGCFVVLYAILVGDIVGPKKMAPSLAVSNFFGSISLTLGPPVAGWLYPLTQSYEPAFYMAGGFTVVGVCLLFLVPLLVTLEVDNEWRICSKSSPKQISSSNSSDTTKSWTLDTGSLCFESKNLSALSSDTKKDLVETKLVKTQLVKADVSFIFEKYSFMPKLVSHQDCMLGKIQESSGNILTDVSDPNRETWV